MPPRPLVVAFDILETTISLEPLRASFIASGLPGTSLEHWFSIGLRDAFALGAAGRYQPFMKVLVSAFDELFAVYRREVDEGLVGTVEAGMKTLPAQPGAVEAFQALSDSGIRIFALTNGSRDATCGILEANSLLDMVEEVISTDAIGFPKPQPQVYRHLLEKAGTQAAQTALVATHGWDLQGAAAVGLTTAFVRHCKPMSNALTRPDVDASSLHLLAKRLLDLA